MIAQQVSPSAVCLCNESKEETANNCSGCLPGRWKDLKLPWNTGFTEALQLCWGSISHCHLHRGRQEHHLPTGPWEKTSHK